MSYRLDDIAAFLQVVETGSISAAAERLSLSKSVVSKRVADLEATLDARLLHRSSRGVMATDRGTLFYQHAKTILRELDAAAAAVSERDDDLCGQLRITAPMSFGTLYLGPILFPLLARHPRLDVALDLNDRLVDIQGEGYDLGIRIARLPDSSLVARRLAVSHRVVCCSPDYARRAGLPSTTDDLMQHACIGYSNVPASQVWQFEPDPPGGEPRALVIRSRISTNNGETMREAAIAGLGIAVLPLFIAAPALADGRLIDALPGARPVVDPIQAVYPQSRQPSRKIRLIVDQLAAALAGPLPWEHESLAPKPAGQR